MNSISVVERIIKTSHRNIPLTKSMQINFLEVNALALFSVLSLRYSESSAPEILLPKSYHDALLTGQTGLSCLQVRWNFFIAYKYVSFLRLIHHFYFQGFGLPLKDCLIKYCHSHFDRMFQAVVEHIETTAQIIIENKLLSHEEKGSHDIGRFKIAFTLSIFLCCNAIIFSIAGTDMNTWEYKNQNYLPSIPLQGYIRKLIAELKTIFTQQLFPAYITSANALRTSPDTFLDAISILNSILEKDNLIICKIEQRDRNNVSVQHCDVSQSVLTLLGSVAFDSNSRTFTEWTKSQSFLDAITATNHTNQDEEQGKKSEEAYASRKIAKLFRESLDPVLVASAIVTFRHLKVVLRRFSRIIQARYQKSLSDNMDDTPNNVSGDNNIHYALKNITTLLGDPRGFSNQQDIIRRSLLDNTVVDSIQCTFCCATLSPDRELPRRIYHEYTIKGKYLGVPYGQFSQGQNRIFFGNEFGYHFDKGELLNYHLRSPQHAANHQTFCQALDHIVNVMARLNTSRELLSFIIQSCGTEGQSVTSSLTSWHLSTAEQARAFLSELDFISNMMADDAKVWSVFPWHNPNPVDKHRGIYDLLSRVEEFFTRKQLEEEGMMQDTLKQMEQGDKNDTGNAENNPIDELMRGPYLMNPNAKEFVPQW